MPLNIGVFGNGYWSKIIQSKLAALDSEKLAVTFVADSTSNHLSRLDEFDLDWAIVASSNSTHYEIVESCLQQGISVFCEKPLVSHPQEVEELYRLAQARGATLYVDDVFMWRKDILEYTDQPLKHSPISARWLKPQGLANPRRCLNDFLYHHLYIIGTLCDFTDKVSVSAHIDQNELQATVTVEEQTYTLRYSLDHPSGVEHMFDTLDLTSMPNDALLDMLSAVFSQSADVPGNQQRTRWATKRLHEAKTQVMPTIGIIGGGIFGSTAAILFANEGCNVTVYQKTDDLLQGATAKNQLRLHRGYHYPRSMSTALSAKYSEVKFKSYYRLAVDTSNRHLYAIARENTKTTPEGFEKFMQEADLEYKKLSDDDAAYQLFRPGVVDAIYEVNESLYDPDTLRAILKKKFAKADVEARYGHAVSLESVKNDHEYVICATYANPVTSDLEYQYEVCEKPIVRLPEEFKKTSILILDGPFMGIDPVPNSPYHILDSVQDAIHHTNIGAHTEVPEYLAPYMEAGLIPEPDNSRYELFLKTGQKFYANFNPTEYKGSYFVTRAVLPYRDHDDARPSIVRQVEDNCYEVFSGKVSTAPSVGQKLVHDLLYTEPQQ